MSIGEGNQRVQPADAVEWFLRVLYGQTYKHIGLAFGTNPQTVSHHVMKLLRRLEHPVYKQLTIEAGLESSVSGGMPHRPTSMWLQQNKELYIPRLLVYANTNGIVANISDKAPMPLRCPIWIPDLDSLQGAISEEQAKHDLERDMGPQMLTALHDPRTVALMLNPDGKLWQERLGEPMRCIGAVSSSRAEAIIKTIARYQGKEVTRAKPILEGELPLDGSRFAGQLPPVVTAPSFSICKKTVTP